MYTFLADKSYFTFLNSGRFLEIAVSGQTELIEKEVGQAAVAKKGMILPFQPLAMTFHNVNYFVDMPKVG